MSENGRAALMTQANEYIKQFIELDGQDRPSKIYTISAGGKVGENCEVTAYSYQSVASSVVVGRVEMLGVWLQVHQDEIDTLL